MRNPKRFFVPWEGYGPGDQQEGRNSLDRLCLQGPHTEERALQLAQEIRNAGFMASVIDCSNTLRYAHAAPDMLKALKEAAKNWIEGKGIPSSVYEAIAKAEGATE